MIFDKTNLGEYNMDPVVQKGLSVIGIGYDVLYLGYSV